MKTAMIRLWSEEQGAVVAAEILLIASILVIGVIVGLAAVRDSVVTELADVAQALANVDQSYAFSGTKGHHAFSGGGAFEDEADFCDRQDLSDRGNSKCVRICSAGVGGEGDGYGGGHGGGHGGHGGHGGGGKW